MIEVFCLNYIQKSNFTSKTNISFHFQNADKHFVVCQNNFYSSLIKRKNELNSLIYPSQDLKGLVICTFLCFQLVMDFFS